MATGILEVLLVSAKGLGDTDFFGTFFSFFLFLNFLLGVYAKPIGSYYDTAKKIPNYNWLLGIFFVLMFFMFVIEGVIANLAGDMDPYVLIQYKGQEHKTSVSRGNLFWNLFREMNI